MKNICIFLRRNTTVNKTIKGACLVAATAMLPLSQAATAGEVNISGWINESMLYFDDSVNSDIIATQDNGTTLASRIAFTGTQELPNSGGMTAGFELSMEPSNGLAASNAQTPLLIDLSKINLQLLGREHSNGEGMISKLSALKLINFAKDKF